MTRGHNIAVLYLDSAWDTHNLDILEDFSIVASRDTPFMVFRVIVFNHGVLKLSPSFNSSTVRWSGCPRREGPNGSVLHF